MSNWRDTIIKEFNLQINRLMLVADPDELIFEEDVYNSICAKGFEVIRFQDHVAFRYDYESRVRVRWEKGEDKGLAVIFHGDQSELDTLPYDVLHAGRQIAFSLADLFPYLSYPVVSQLGTEKLDLLFKAQQSYVSENFGQNPTRDFILRHIFEIVPELIKEPVDLLRMLIKLHYKNLFIPKEFINRLIALLRTNEALAEWPLELLITTRETFFTFLQERWPLFLQKIYPEVETVLKDVATVLPENALVVKGPAQLPFDDYEIKVYLDNLFAEGLLEAVEFGLDSYSINSWVSIGIQNDPEKNKLERISRLFQSLEENVATENPTYGEWQHFAHGWAELKVLFYSLSKEHQEEQYHAYAALMKTVDATFSQWLQKRMGGLISLSPAKPVMVHHLPRYLAREAGSDLSKKIVLVVVDGLALDQWLVLREVVAENRSHWSFHEASLFAWVPSITSVSRQSIFSGKMPMHFSASITRTSKEEDLWKQFWSNHNFRDEEVVYAKQLGEESLDSLKERLSHPQVRIAGLVIDMVDRIMHGMELGTAGMHSQIRQWAKQSYFCELLELLLTMDFSVFVTSDHGNVEALGWGQPREGVIASIRGERVRVSSDRGLRSRVKQNFPDAVEWEPVGLPEDWLPLLASGRNSFSQKGKRVVSHGGISIEEIIVPLVEIKKATSQLENGGEEQ